MRIIAGIARGMTLTVPRGDKTRPTSDRTREAIFSSLGDRVPGAIVLDLFAGTGGLGLEAASRGATTVRFVEDNRQAFDCLRNNVESARRYPGMNCDLEIVREDVFQAVARSSAAFNIILADPPYGEMPQRLVDAISPPKLLAPGGLLVLEAAKRDRLAFSPSWKIIRDGIYGDTRVLFLANAASREM